MTFMLRCTKRHDKGRVDMLHVSNDLSTRRVIGFACNQGFVLFLFYMGFNRSLSLGSMTFERAELFSLLVFMVIGFALLKIVSRKVCDLLLSRPFLYIYAVVMVVGALGWTDSITVFELPVLGIFLGLTESFLLMAWGRAFGAIEKDQSIPEVFVGSLVAALICLICGCVAIPGIMYVLRVLPLISAILVTVPSSSDAPTAPSASLSSLQSGSDTILLSLKILVGTFLFGISAGIMQTFDTDPGTATMPSYPVALLLFGAFLAGGLSLLLSDGFGRGAALNKLYRVTIFMITIGFLLVPLPEFALSVLPGDSIVLAGYLSLTVVLIALFLIIALITSSDVAASFSRGFMALYGGEAVGVLIANGIDCAQTGDSSPYTFVAIAGVLVLFSYVFLFTERDFDDLSRMVTDTNSFDAACEKIAREGGLSRRETEILPYVLKGRTSERIAGELCISKSTVDTHLRRIYAKVDVHSRQELIDLSEREQLR